MSKLLKQVNRLTGEIVKSLKSNGSDILSEFFHSQL